MASQRTILDNTPDDLERWVRSARECDDAILRYAGARATINPTFLHRLGHRTIPLAIGVDLARVMWARWQAHRDYGTGTKAFRAELRRMGKAVGWYILACFGIGTMERAKDYIYAGRDQPVFSVCPAR